MNIRIGLVLTLVAASLMGPLVVAQQAEVAVPPAKSVAPPAKGTPPAKALSPSGEVVVADPSTAGGTPAGKQIYAKDRASAVAKCKVQCPSGGTLTPSVPPSDYWYCKCTSAISE